MGFTVCGEKSNLNVCELERCAKKKEAKFSSHKHTEKILSIQRVVSVKAIRPCRKTVCRRDVPLSFLYSVVIGRSRIQCNVSRLSISFEKRSFHTKIGDLFIAVDFQRESEMRVCR